MRYRTGLFALFIMLLLSRMTLAAESLAGPEDNAIESVLSNSKTLQRETLALLDELYFTEQSILYPQQDLLLILFAQDHGADIYLQRLELSIDDKPVEVHYYRGGDLEKLMDNAEQSLFSTLVPAGNHTLRARLYGLGLMSGPYIEGEATIAKGKKALYIKLLIQSNSLAFKEWN